MAKKEEMKTVAFKITAIEHRRLRMLAAKADRKINEVMRTALQDFLRAAEQ